MIINLNPAPVLKKLALHSKIYNINESKILPFNSGNMDKISLYYLGKTNLR